MQALQSNVEAEKLQHNFVCKTRLSKNGWQYGTRRGRMRKNIVQHAKQYAHYADKMVKVGETQPHEA